MSNAYNLVIPFSQLRRSAGNVRRSGRSNANYLAGIATLAASIRSTHLQTGQGLLQNLVVHADGEFFDVVAGGRRFDAIGLLVTQGQFLDDYPIPCLVIGADAVTSASLSENVQREAMHPADELDAFKELTEQGWTIDRIADSFGVTPLVVERRLKLRAAAPALIADFRAGALTTDQLIALCSTDNHDLQTEVWNRVRDQHWNKDPASLRRAVIVTEVDASKDPRVPFIGGVDVYEKAGGNVRRDLFATDGEGVILADSTLLDALVHGKIHEQAEEVRTEGWGWVEVWQSFDWTKFERLGRAPTILTELSDELAQELAALGSELADVQAIIESMDESELSEEDAARYQVHDDRVDELSDLISKIEGSRAGFTSAVRKHAGVVVSFNHGSLRIDRGMVRAADRNSVTEASGDGQRVYGGRETESAGRKPDAISDALRRSLLAHRNLAAQYVTTTNANAAKILLACKFVTDSRSDWNATPTDLSVGTGYGTRTGCTITDDAGQLKEAEFVALGKKLIEALPVDHGELWDALAAMNNAELDRLLAFAVARSVSLAFEPSKLSDKYLHALSLNMADHFTPTANNYLGRVSKDLIIQALSETGKIAGDEDLNALLGMKKGTLAQEAEARLAGTGWVPSLIRTAEAKATAKKGTKKSGEKGVASIA
ncbi:ParB/RepB/Spo0J family partition protein [Pseudomonas sp. AB12(2023)]|uniref:ParB/RepB/Spo0J family partition protein n=1 Tax=Pseudomonas sp. AB12(2023) TaxID=3048597 RepID=UPI002B23E489|nr:ParB/RepB/Spo0J family partition protein [Pseudomonas sp. AB12(2023)]MEB0222145.1 ParB/RepB/Spo0J family partition protein [Pseudomonas sp. AB12(2023)]